MDKAKRDKILAIVKAWSIKETTEYQIVGDDKFSNLNMDSLDVLCAVQEIEEEFKLRIPAAKIEDFEKIEDLINYVDEENKKFEDIVDKHKQSGSSK